MRRVALGRSLELSATLPSPPTYLTSATAATWQEMKLYGYWLTSADRWK
jgi:hypothetical protein